MADVTALSLLTASSNYNNFAVQVDTGFFQTENTFEFLLAADNRDLVVIKKADTGTNSTEVHILSADSNYRSYTLQTGTALGETDHTWTFGLAANRDLFAIKRANNTSDRTEVHVLTRESGYQTFSVHAEATALEQTDQNWQFLVGANNDLYVIKKQRTGTKTTEVHVLTATSNYQTFGLHTGSGIPETDLNWDFFGLNSENDIYAIKRTDAAPELYILNSVSQYQQFVKIPVQLPKTDYRYAFVLAEMNNSCDLFAIKKSSTSSGYTEVQVVSATSNYTSLQAEYRCELGITDGLYEFSWTVDKEVPEQNDLCVVKKNQCERADNTSGNVEVVFLREPTKWQKGRRFVTAWPKTDDTCQFILANTRDLFVIKKSRCESKKTEVHILAWTTSFQSYALEVPTPLEETDSSWTFLLAENLDVIAIHKSNTPSGKTEFMELRREENYQSMGVYYETCLDETDDSWDFLLAPNRDLYAIQKYGTSSGRTEVKVLSERSKYSKITNQFQTALPHTDYNYSFCLAEKCDLVAIQKSRFPFTANMASS